MRWLDSISDSVDMRLSKLWQIGKDREAWHTVVHGATKTRLDLVTELQQRQNEEEAGCSEGGSEGVHVVGTLSCH